MQSSRTLGRELSEPQTFQLNGTWALSLPPNGQSLYILALETVCVRPMPELSIEAERRISS